VVNQVPLGRYFLFVGSLLLGMLFVAERYWQDSNSSNFVGEARYDNSVIRIKSAHRWPERIIIDTSLPTIVPPPTSAFAEPPLVSSPREAFALLNAPTRKVPEYTAPVRIKRKLVKRPPETQIAGAAAKAEMLPAGW
jgi:hypothetical protein